MFYAGIADEAGEAIEDQIRAHKELGWSHIELRNVDGKCVTDLTDQEFDSLAEALDLAGMNVVGFASQLANWSRPIDGDFDLDLKEIGRALPRMQRCGSKFIRCMSYPNSAATPWSDTEWRDEVVRRFQTLARIALDGGVTLVHENCHGWASQDGRHSLEFIERVNSPALKLVFDTGNTRNIDSFEFYRQVRDHVVHIHIKDWKTLDDGSVESCYPGEGESQTDRVLADLFASGYDGCLSIEPHMVAVIHLGKDTSDDPQHAYDCYVEYGRRLMSLVDSLLAKTD